MVQNAKKPALIQQNENSISIEQYTSLESLMSVDYESAIRFEIDSKKVCKPMPQS
jgi:hypothetical protein